MKQAIQYADLSYSRILWKPEFRCQIKILVNAMFLFEFEFKYNEKEYPVEKYIKDKVSKRYIEKSYIYTN